MKTGWGIGIATLLVTTGCSAADAPEDAEPAPAPDTSTVEPAPEPEAEPGGEGAPDFEPIDGTATVTFQGETYEFTVFERCDEPEERFEGEFFGLVRAWSEDGENLFDLSFTGDVGFALDMDEPFESLHSAKSWMGAIIDEDTGMPDTEKIELIISGGVISVPVIGSDLGVAEDVSAEFSYSCG